MIAKKGGKICSKAFSCTAMKFEFLSITLASDAGEDSVVQFNKRQG